VGAACDGVVPGGDAEPDRGGDDAGDGLVNVGPQLAVLVVDVDAALAGQLVPVLDELLNRRDAGAGGEQVVQFLEQLGRVHGGGGLPAGEGLPCLDGGQVEVVAGAGLEGGGKVWHRGHRRVLLW